MVVCVDMPTEPNRPKQMSGSGEDLAREVCLCFHVSLSKLMNFARRNRPKVAAQMSECYGAGTGCGWCRPQLERILQEVAAHPDQVPHFEMTPAQYEEGRRRHREESRSGGGLVADEEPLADALE